MNKKLKSLPPLLTDEEAEHFVDTADLSEYDLSGFKPYHFEFKKQAEATESNMRQETSESAPAEDTENC